MDDRLAELAAKGFSKLPRSVQRPLIGLALQIGMTFTVPTDVRVPSGENWMNADGKSGGSYTAGEGQREWYRGDDGSMISTLREEGVNSIVTTVSGTKGSVSYFTLCARGEEPVVKVLNDANGVLETLDNPDRQFLAVCEAIGAMGAYKTMYPFDVVDSKIRNNSLAFPETDLYNI